MTRRRPLNPHHFLALLLLGCSATTAPERPVAPSPTPTPTAPVAVKPVSARPAPQLVAETEKPAPPSTKPGWKLEELRSPSPGVVPREAHAKGIEGGARVIAILSAICREIVVVDEHLACAAPWGPDSAAVEWFDLKEGSFSRAGAQQAIVSASVGSDAYTFRHFLIERRRGRWVALNTFLLEGEILQQRELKDRRGQSLLLRAVGFAGSPVHPVSVQALRFSEQGVELASLAEFAGSSVCDPESFALSRLSVSGTRFLLAGQGYQPTPELAAKLGSACAGRKEEAERVITGLPRAEKTLAFDYDGQRFIADAQARATLHLEKEAMEWEAARSWDLEAGAATGAPK